MTDKSVCGVGGGRTRYHSSSCGEILVDIRYGGGVTKLSDLDHLQATGEIEIVVLDSIERAVDQLRVSYSRLNGGDTLIIFVANEALYAAAENALGLRA